MSAMMVQNSNQNAPEQARPAASQLQPLRQSSRWLEAKIEDCRQELIQRLRAVKDMDTLIVESKKKAIFLQKRSMRGSRYRGVSKNGDKW